MASLKVKKSYVKVSKAVLYISLIKKDLEKLYAIQGLTNASERIRTSYPRFRRPMLYPDELQAHLERCRSLKKMVQGLTCTIYRVPSRDRTDDNQIHNLALYR